MVREITVEQLAVRLAEASNSTALLDVRQPEEHAIASLPGSTLIPLPELTARAGELTTAAGHLLIVYCHHGIRSRSAATLLERLGFRDVVSLAGGIDAWSQRVDPAVPRY